MTIENVHLISLICGGFKEYMRGKLGKHQQGSNRVLSQLHYNLSAWAELFKAGLRQPRVSARFEFRFESFKSISVLILFVYKLMIGSSKNSTEIVR